MYLRRRRHVDRNGANLTKWHPAASVLAQVLQSRCQCLPEGTSAAFRSETSFLTDSNVPLHFQLPPTKNLPCPAIAVTRLWPAQMWVGSNRAACVRHESASHCAA